MDNFSRESEIIEFAEKYFAMSADEAEQALLKTKAKKFYNESYLYAVLSAIKPYFDRFIALTPIDLQRKIGRVAFENLNFFDISQYEKPGDIFLRLRKFFEETSDFGINPYKIFYSSVISKAHLFYNKEGQYSNFKSDTANFKAVSSAISRQLGIDKKKVAKMYERCSTLCYKVDVVKVSDNYTALRLLFINSRPLLDGVEVKEILRNNPTLYACSKSIISLAFSYLKEKAEIYKARTKDEHNLSEILASWIKNNSSALALNVKGMREKEGALTKFLQTFASKSEVDAVINSIFDNPTNICAINKISSDTFFKNNNYISTIRTLITYLDNDSGRPVNTIRYLMKSKLVYSVDGERLKQFLEKVKDADQLNKTNIMQKFAERGDAVFGYFNKFTDEQIIEKLMANKILFPIKLYNMTKSTIAQKFYEVFSNNADGNFEYFNRLLRKNYYYEIICRNLDFAEEYLREFDFDLREKADLRGVAENIKNAVLSFTSAYVEYADRYIKTTMREDVKDYQMAVRGVKKEIENLYNEGAILARERYENVDELYETFKKNTEEKLSIHNNPIFRRDNFLRKLMEASKVLEKDATTRQLTIYDNFTIDKDKEEAYKSLKTALNSMLALQKHEGEKVKV